MKWVSVLLMLLLALILGTCGELHMNPDKPSLCRNFEDGCKVQWGL